MGVELRAGEDDNGRRLDRILRKALPDLPLSGIHRLLRRKQVLVDGLPGRAAARIRSGQLIRVEGLEMPESGKLPPDGTRALSPGKPLRIIWEGAGLLALNKDAGVQVHGLNGLDEQVRTYLQGKLPASLSFRPGPLHRLDKPTSGILIFSVSLEGARIFSALLRARLLRKRYLALVDGKLTVPGLWEETLFRDTRRRKTETSVLSRPEPSGGQAAGPESVYGPAKTARTRVFPLAAGGGYSLVLLEIETGRTHQIRSQAAFHGHPLAGDRKYGGSLLSGSLLLHAFSLEFPPKPGEARKNTGAWNAAGWDELWGKKLWAELPGRFLTQIRRIFGEKTPEFMLQLKQDDFSGYFLDPETG
jgi:23S rRNA pseudouridine955/2504/2580 synthase